MIRILSRPWSRSAAAALALALLAALCIAGAARAAPPRGPEGQWLGTLEVGSIKLRLAFHIERGTDGALRATLDSLDQGATGIAVDKVAFDAPHVVLEITKLHARFDGTLDGDRLTGTFSQGRALPLALSRVDKIEALRRPQTPIRPFPYAEQEVAISVAAAPRDRASHDRITLAGTLTLPPGKGPFPAVVFITGSGPQDRDETLFEHRPFLVLSDALTRRGIATLRVDDRGVGKSTGSAAQSTTLDFAEDVIAELAWLAARPEIDRRAIGVIGHSEGGIIGPIVATRSPLARFVVMLAGTGMRGDRILTEQSVLIGRARGKPEAELERGRAAAEALYPKLRSARTEAEAQAAVQAFFAADPATRDSPVRDAQVLVSPWMRAFLDLDPASYLAKVRVPVLAISGENDLQVPRANLPLIEAALRRGKNPDATVAVMPGLNHLFQHSASGLPSEYGAIEETFAPEAIQRVCDWVVDRTARLRR